MICISVTPESRKLAKVDLLNASRYCDLIELCLDRLIKVPDVGALLEGIDKPVLISCRRQQDGGQWDGSEEDRLALLRQAIVAEPAYVELDLDIAKKIPRFGKTKRVIGYTRVDKPLTNVDTIFESAYKVDADVVKFTWPTPTLNAAWPLLVAVTKKRELPVVGMGLGHAGLTFSLLGRKYGSPWIYAALEKGMEAHEGQATVWELDEIYGWRRIDSGTRFIGLVGLGPAETTTVRALNAAFDTVGLNARCLPLEISKFDQLPKMLDILRINALVVGSEVSGKFLEFADHPEEAARDSQYTDLLLKQSDGWHAYNTLWRSALRAIEGSLDSSRAEERPLDRRNVLVLGGGPLAQSMAYGIHRRKGVLSFAAAQDTAARKIAQLYDTRFVPFYNVYDTLSDVVVMADPELKMGHKKTELNPAYLRETMTVADVCHLPDDSSLITEARQRGCKVVEPGTIYFDQLATQFQAITGQSLPEEAVQAALASGGES